jgi:hypothetical protein
MPLPIEDARWYFDGTITNKDNTYLEPLDFGSDMAGRLVLLRSLHLVQTGGTAATFQPAVWDENSVATLINRRHQASSVAAAAMSESDGLEKLIRLDAEGKCYLQPNPVSNADNDYQYVAEFSPVREIVVP